MAEPSTMLRRAAAYAALLITPVGCARRTEGMPMTEVPAFSVGDHVEKFTGDYQVRGVVVARFYTLKHKLRYVVEFGGGILHVFNQGQLRHSREQDHASTCTSSTR